MECPNCSFQNMPGLKRCGRCASVLDLSDVEWQPPRSRQSKGTRAVVTALRRDVFATREDLGRGGERLRSALAGAGARPASWTAVTLSILPGLGHLWLGRRWLGTIILIAWLLLLLGMLLQFGTGTGWLLYFLAVGLHTTALSLLFAPAMRYLGAIHRAVIGVAVWAAIQAALYLPVGWVTSRCVTLTRVEGILWNPEIANGDLLVTSGPWIGDGRWQRGDLVLYRVEARSGQGFFLQSGQAIDRIIGVAGDMVEMKAGSLRVNGALVPAELLPINGIESVPADFRSAVGPDRVLILPSTINALNRQQNGVWQAAYLRLAAETSLVRSDQIVGRVTFRLLPWSRFGPSSPRPRPRTLPHPGLRPPLRMLPHHDRPIFTS